MSRAYSRQSLAKELGHGHSAALLSLTGEGVMAVPCLQPLNTIQLCLYFVGALGSALFCFPGLPGTQAV